MVAQSLLAIPLDPILQAPIFTRPDSPRTLPQYNSFIYLLSFTVSLAATNGC